MQGYVYIFTNPLFDDLIKIGYSKNINNRLNQLGTSSPENFECYFHIKVNNCKEFERKVHDYFKKYRYNKSKEFFKVDKDEVKKKMISMSKLPQFKEKPDYSPKIKNETNKNPNKKDVRVGIRFSKDNKALSHRRERDGKWIRLASGIYSDKPDEDIDLQIRKELPKILKHLNWDGLLAYKSALPDAVKKDFSFLINGKRVRNFKMGSFEFKGYEANENELIKSHSIPLYNSLLVPTPIRSFLENCSLRKVDKKKIVAKEVLKEYIYEHLEKSASHMGVKEAVDKFNEEVKIVSKDIKREGEAKVLLEFVNDWVIYKSGHEHVLYDYIQVKNFEKMAKNLTDFDFDAVDLKVNNNSMFFESYFSNYIEGIKVSLDDAASFVKQNKISNSDFFYDKNKNDVLRTYNLIMSQHKSPPVWNNSKEFINWLKSSHKNMFHHRVDEINAGGFKTKNNRVGGTEFVDVKLVEGTLEKVFNIYKSIPDGFAKAIFLSTAFVCVHPFQDGNGRLSRLILNCELEKAKMGRLIVPNVLREDYLLSLSAWSNHQDIAPLSKFWMKSNRVVSEINFDDDLENIVIKLKEKNAFEESKDAKWIFNKNTNNNDYQLSPAKKSKIR